MVHEEITHKDLTAALNKHSEVLTGLVGVVAGCKNNKLNRK